MTRPRYGLWKAWQTALKDWVRWDRHLPPNLLRRVHRLRNPSCPICRSLRRKAIRERFPELYYLMLESESLMERLKEISSLGTDRLEGYTQKDTSGG